MSATPSEGLADALRAEGGLLAPALVAPTAPATASPDAPGAAAAGAGVGAGSPPAARDADALARRAAAGPRANGAPEEYGLVLAAVREGYALHYGEGALVRPVDPDLALLGGDRLYALGLERLAALGDLAAVIELADLISLCAQAHADASDPDGGAALADAAWLAAATAIGHGSSAAHTRAKERARAGAADSAGALRAAAEGPDRP